MERKQTNDKRSLNRFIPTYDCSLTINHENRKLEELTTKELYWFQIIEHKAARPTRGISWQKDENLQLDKNDPNISVPLKLTKTQKCKWTLIYLCSLKLMKTQKCKWSSTTNCTKC